MTFDMTVLKARWLLEFLSDEELPREVGIEGLAAGHDTESLRVLSITEDRWAARDLFQKVSEELELPAMTIVDAARLFARSVCEDIVGGRVTPYEGAKAIWRARNRIGGEDFHEFDSFIYCASELEDRPEDAEFFNRAIMEAAGDFLQAGPK